jgi:hypothetical protein
MNLLTISNSILFTLKFKFIGNHLSVSCQLDLFDKIIIPMLTYGSEIWGYENIDILEKVHVKFCKLLLDLKTCTLPLFKMSYIALEAFFARLI